MVRFASLRAADPGRIVFRSRAVDALTYPLRPRRSRRDTADAGAAAVALAPGTGLPPTLAGAARFRPLDIRPADLGARRVVGRDDCRRAPGTRASRTVPRATATGDEHDADRRRAHPRAVWRRRESALPALGHGWRGTPFPRSRGSLRRHPHGDGDLAEPAGGGARSRRAHGAGQRTAFGPIGARLRPVTAIDGGRPGLSGRRRRPDAGGRRALLQLGRRRRAGSCDRQSEVRPAGPGGSAGQRLRAALGPRRRAPGLACRQHARGRGGHGAGGACTGARPPPGRGIDSGASPSRALRCCRGADPPARPSDGAPISRRSSRCWCRRLSRRYHGRVAGAHGRERYRFRRRQPRPHRRAQFAGARSSRDAGHLGTTLVQLQRNFVVTAQRGRA